MTRKMRWIVWICLFVSLLLMYSGLSIRLSNENNNRSVITAVEYNEFFKASNKAHMDMEDLLAKLADSGVAAMGVKETTIADLIYTGDVFAASAGEFLSAARNNSPASFDRFRDFLGAEHSNPSSRLLVTDRRETADFLKERLGRRFGGDQFSVLETEGKTLFLMKTEIDEKYDVGLGFDEHVLKYLKDKGFEILLRPKEAPGSGNEYLAEYDRVIGDYEIRYVVFDGNTAAGSPERLSALEDIIRKRNVTVGIIENPTQIGYMEQKGLNSLILNTGYPINRVYIAPDSYLLRLDKEELFYQWLRGVVDRNIRIVYVNPLRNQKSTFRENIDNTVYSVGKFTAFISDKGYAIRQPLARLSARMPSALHFFIVALSLVFGGILYLAYLLDNRFKAEYAAVLAVLGAGFAFLLKFVLHFGLAKPLALAAAILYPSLSTLILLKYLKDKGGTGHPVRHIAASLGVLLGVNAIGMYTVVSTLSDIRYTMNVELFRGVLVSFAFPVLLFVVNFIFCFAGYGKIRDYLAAIAESKVTYLAAAIALLGALGFYIYLARSGNTMGVSASTLELKMRELFEKTLVARPRFKEFLIGYPALFVMVYLYNRYRKEMIPFLLGLGVAVGSVSMVNSFCHVFTAVSVSVSRTLYGLILGVVVGAGLVIVLHILLNLYRKLYAGDKN